MEKERYEVIVQDEAVAIVLAQGNEVLVSEINLNTKQTAGFKKVKRDKVIDIVKKAKTLIRCRDVFVPYIQAYEHKQDIGKIKPTGKSWDILLNPGVI